MAERQKRIVHPDDYAGSLQELSEADSSENDSDVIDEDSEEEIINKSDHDSESEIELTPELEKESDDEKSSDNNSFGNDHEFFEKKMYLNVKGDKQIIEIHKWKKTPFSSNFSLILKKNIRKKILPLPKNNIDITDELSAFSKFVTSDMIDMLVYYTNLNISKILTANTQEQKRNINDTSRDEIMALLGILYLVGVKKASKENLRDLWTDDGTGIEILRGVMGINRFKFLLGSMRFDDKSTRSERRKTDKLAAIRLFLDPFIRNCQVCYSPGEEVTIDEILVPFLGRCSFIQYMAKKPAKYGIKMFALVDSKTFFTNNIEIYCGAQSEGPYCVSNSPAGIVNRLIGHLKGSCRNLTTDSWFTSYPLAQSLLNDSISLLGTLQPDRKEIPPEFLPSKSRQTDSSLFGFQEDISMVSYVPKENRAVILLSTMHDDASIDKDTGKPSAILDYYRTNGGVDVVDKLGGTYTVARGARRWPMAVFYAFLNIAGINSQIMLKSSSPESALSYRHHFLKNLALSLMKPHLKQRSWIPSLPGSSNNIIKRQIEELEAKASEESPKKRGRCYLCGRKKNINTTVTCTKCSKFVCKKHVKVICESCHNCSANSYDLSE